jgi:Tfp pilus assembly protein PilX
MRTRADRRIARLLNAMPPHARRVARTLHHGDDGAALLLTVLTIVIVTGLALVLLAVLLGQFGPAYSAEKRTKTVYAAEAGLQTGLDTLRNAKRTVAGGKVFGDVTALNCQTHPADGSGPTSYTELNGSVDSAANGTDYTVRISYYSDDPTGQTDDWLAGNAIDCTSGLGDNVPAYAVVTSTARVSDADEGRSALGGDGARTVSGIYQFKVTTTNVSGGRIWNRDRTQCLRADRAARDSGIRFVDASECEKDDDASNALLNWLYDTKWHIVLASTTVDDSDSDDLCITDPNGDAPQRAQLQHCGDGRTHADDNQRWAWDGNRGWYGMKPVNDGGWTTAHLNRGGDGYLRIARDETQFDPDAKVGAGAASKTTNQLVNYKEFGRCADVTNVRIDYGYMIVYPCKQDPTGANNFDWNHKWYYTEPARYYDPNDSRHDTAPETCSGDDAAACTAGNQQITVKVNNSDRYCLTVVDPHATTSELQYKKCNGGKSQNFTRYTAMSDNAKSWTIQDAYGRCLTADNSRKHDTSWSHLTMTTCASNDFSQKWNAPALSTSTSFGGFREGEGD